jgi:chorismate-pyruvate lyase
VDEEKAQLHQDLGYLTKAVEDIGEMLKKHVEQSDRKGAAVDGRLIAIENQLSVYKTVVRTVRFIGVAFALMLTAQWQSLLKLIHPH